MRFLVAGPACVLFLAGCMGGPDLAPAAGTAGSPLAYYLDDIFPVDADHSDADHHNMRLHDAAHNVEFVGHHACTADGRYDPASPGGFTDLAFHGTLLFAGTGSGFCVLDVADPASPRLVARYAGPPASDLEASADGRTVFLTTQRNPIEVPSRGVIVESERLPRGVHVVDVEDPAQPSFESFYAMPTNGVHTASTFLMGSRQLVFLQTYDWVPPGELYRLAPQLPKVQENNAPLTHRVEITELVSGPDGKRTLQRLAVYEFLRPPTEPLVHVFPHDSFAQVHPVTGKTYLYVAYWDAGLIVLDITDPSKPTFVGQYQDPAPSRYNHYHDVEAFAELIDGRHVTVTSPEIEQGPETGVVRILDTTDPAHPVQLGAWRLPGQLGVPGGFLFSPHVLTLHAGRIYLGHNHGGVWVVDVSNAENLREPKPIGFYFPHGDARLPAEAWSDSSVTWGAYVHESVLYASEGRSGVHALRFLGDVASG